MAAPIVFPVRFVAEGAAVQTTSRELSAEGISICCLTPPRVGARVSMALYLPGASRPEVAVGLVSDASLGVVKPKDAGFWAQFIAVDPMAKSRIASVLATRDASDAQSAAAAQSKGKSADNRVFPRFTAHFKVCFSTAREFVFEYANNISQGGIFIVTQEPPPLDRAVQVLLELPDGGPPVATNAVVVHRVTPEEAKRTNQPAGVGVQFIGANDAFRERIDLYIESISGKPLPV